MVTVPKSIAKRFVTSISAILFQVLTDCCLMGCLVVLPWLGGRHRPLGPVRWPQRWVALLPPVCSHHWSTLALPHLDSAIHAPALPGNLQQLKIFFFKKWKKKTTKKNPQTFTATPRTYCHMVPVCISNTVCYTSLPCYIAVRQTL